MSGDQALAVVVQGGLDVQQPAAVLGQLSAQAVALADDCGRGGLGLVGAAGRELLRD